MTPSETRKPVHPKVKATGIAGTATTVVAAMIVALLESVGVDPNTPLSVVVGATLAALASFAAGYVKKS